MADYDAVVVGASIAGCTVATLLARAGASVALVESHSDPRAFKRICTHAIQPSACQTLERLGLLSEIERRGGRPGDMHLWTRYGWVSYAHEWAPAPARGRRIWNVRRETLDPMMRELAAATSGVTLLLGHTASGLLREQEASDAIAPDKARAGRIAGVLVRERDGGERELRARVVIGADGRDSRVAALARQATREKKHNRFIYYAYYRDTPVAAGDSTQLWLLDPDVAYAFPTDGGLTLLACMAHKRRLGEFKADPEAAMARLFESLPDAPRLDPSRRESSVMGKLDMPNIVRRPTAPGLALVGDAALAADPLWGVGCGWALQSAEWLADALGEDLREGRELDQALARYARRHRRGLHAHEVFCSAYSTARKFNPVQKLVYRAAARDRQMAEAVALVGGRWIDPRRLLTPRMLGRMLRVNLSRARRPNGLIVGSRSTAGASGRPAQAG